MISVAADIAEDFRHVGLAFAFELRKHWRRYRIVLGGLLSLAVPLLFYFVPRFTETPFPATVSLFIGTNLGFVNALVLVTAAFYGGDAISAEVDKRTYLLSYVTPQRRTSAFAGKYLAALLLIVANVTIYYAVTLGEAGAIYGFGSVPAPLTTSYGVACLYSLSALSIAFFFTSFIRSAITSTLLALFTLILVLPIVQAVLYFVSIEPWFVPTYSAGLITQVFGTMSGFGEAATAIGYGTVFTPDFILGLQVLAAWTLVLAPLGAFIAARRELA